MRKWKRRLAWLMIVAMLAGSSLTSFADVSAVDTGLQEKQDEGREAQTATRSDASGESGAKNDSASVATESEVDKNELFAVEYVVDPAEAAKVSGKDEVKYGKDLKFQVKPEKGYEIEAVTANGEVIEGEESALGIGRSLSYVIENIQMDQSIEISLKEQEAERPAFSYEQKLAGVTVSITAEAGVLPEGTTAKVKAVSSGKTKVLERKAAAEGNEDAVLQELIAYDIKLYDADGKELDDSWSENGAVKVSFSGERLEEQQERAEETKILHFDEGETDAEVKAVSKDEELSIDAAHFSVFAIGFYGAKKATESDVIYVSSDRGKDETGDGSEDAPYASLARAAEQINENKAGGKTYQINLLSDLTMIKSARFNYGNSVVINGNGHTVERGADFETAADNNRKFYNPAMFEINNWSDGDAESSLTFQDVTIDEDGKHKGTEFRTQYHGESGDNTEVVQDAIVASYSPYCKIVLGKDAVLKNFGGLSAVNVEAGAEIIMEEDSAILDDNTVDREKGYGAIHAESGGIVTIEAGAKIGGTKDHYMKGHGIFLENDSSASVAGTIEYIQNAKATKKQNDGIAIYVYNNSNAILEATGLIDNIQGVVADGAAAISVVNSTFETKENSVISNVVNTAAVYPWGNGGSDSSKEMALLNGIVQNCSSQYLFRTWYSRLTIGPTGIVQNNESTGPGIFYGHNGTQFKFEGKIIDNSGSCAIYLINQSGGECTGFIEEGAIISGKGSGKGVYINASGTKLYMNGGTIENFSTGVECRGKEKFSATFIMNGGIIHNNKDNAIIFKPIATSEAIVDLNGGVIENNGTNSQISINTDIKSVKPLELYDIDNAQDEFERIKLNNNVIKGNPTISIYSFGSLTLDADYASIQLGLAKKVASERLNKLLKEGKDREDWTTVGPALWFKPSETTLHFTMARPSSIDPALGLYIGYIELNPDGTPKTDVELKLEPISNTATLDITLNGLLNENESSPSYAAMLVQNVSRTLKPADITIYTGGGSGTADYTTGLPLEASYAFKLEGLPNSINEVTVNGEQIPGTPEELAEKLRALFTIRYVDQEGKPLANDQTPGEYRIQLEYQGQGRSRANAVPVSNLKINGNDISVTEGKLIIRDIKDKENAVNGSNVHKLSAEAPTATSSVPVVVPPKNASYQMNGDSKRIVSNAEGISVLNDSLFEKEEATLKERINKDNEAFKPLPGQQAYQVGAAYLDLVDAYNGNVWVSTGYKKTTIYLPYPDGKSAADESFTPQVLYLDVKREYGMNGTPEIDEALSNAEGKILACEKTEAGIKVTAPAGNIGGIYAVVWPEQLYKVSVQYRDIENEDKSIKDTYTEQVLSGHTYDVTEQIQPEIAGYRYVKTEPADAIKGIANENKTLTSYYQAVHPPVITTKTLPDGSEDTAYTATIEAEGDAPIEFVVKEGSGSLPKGLTLDRDGKMSGTPEEVGTFTFTVVAKNNVGADEKNYTLTIHPHAVKKIVVRYLDINDLTDEKPLLPDEVIEQKFGESYDVTAATKRAIEGYRFVKVDPNNDKETGTADEDKLVIVYYQVANLPLIITDGKLPKGYVGDAYEMQIIATGDPVIKFEIVGENQLPSWLSFSEDGKLTGSLKEAGTYTFTVRAYNSYGEEDKREFTLTVKARKEKDIIVRYLDIADNKPLADNYKTTAGFENVYDVREQTKRVIDGYRLVKIDPNHDDPFGIADGDKLIIVYYEKTNPPCIVTEWIPGGIEGDSYNVQIVTTGDPVIRLEVVSTEALPSWLTLTEDGRLYGTLGEAGKYSFTLRAYNDRGEEDKWDYELLVASRGEKLITVKYLDIDTGVEITAAEPRAVEFGATYDVSAEAQKEIEGYSFVKTEGAVSGTAVDDVNVISYYKKNAPIPQPKAPVITTETLADGKVGTAYSQTILATGDAPIQFAITAGSLPEGLALSADGTLSGTPLAAGSFTVTVTASNVAGTDAKQYVIQIAAKSTEGGNGGNGGGGSSSAGSGRGATYTVGLDGRWVHMDPNDLNKPISEAVPDGMTPVSGPKWHAWKFYLNNGGILTNRWAYIKNPYAVNDQPREGWFAFDKDGIMQYGWYLDEATGKWYYLHRESDGMLGTMETGWHYDEQDGKWYYLSPKNGEMLLGWQEIDGKWYYLNPTAPTVTWNYSAETGGWTFNGTASRPYGSLYQNEQTPDGHQVGEDGARIG